MDKWVFFLDIDGTLVANGQIPEENVNAVNEAVKQGHYVFLCTGRPLANIAKPILNAARWSGVIASMGAEIYVGDTKLRERTVSRDYVKRVVSKLLEEDVWAVFGNIENCLSIKNKHIDIKDVSELDKVLNGVTKMDFATSVSKELEELISQEMYVLHHDRYYEASVKGVSKSEGIQFVMDKLNIPHRFSVAVGDSVNDIDMIKYAGIGVAMGNALDEVKAAADRVTLENTNCGVARIIREIIK